MGESTRTTAATASEPDNAGDCFDRLRERVQQCMHEFQKRPATPWAAYEFEKQLQAVFDETARQLLEEEFNRREPTDQHQAAPKVRYRGQTYRRNKRTKAEVATSFGTITLWSFLYLCEEDGEPGLHPLHVQLGIGAGKATAVLAERVGRWAVDHSQREVRALLLAEHGLRWSNDRLRQVLRDLRRGLVAFRAEAQTQRLLQWLGEAERSRGRHRPVLAAGRDGVMVPIRGAAYQEASAATVSVYDRRGRRLGTVYLGQMPQKHQATLTEQLTSLVQAVLQQWSGPLPRLAYVTDKGQAQDDYYRRVLRRMKHPRYPQQRLVWEWVLDFFHVCSYVSKLRDALFADAGQRWFRRMRHWLRDREQGVTQILRSAVQHYHQRTLTKEARREFWKAYRYLRRHSRWMAYARYRRQGLPIGSGVTEAACKTVFTQRLKRAGMRWHADSGQVIVDLRVLVLSGIWTDVVQRYLRSRRLPQRVETARSRLAEPKSFKRAAYSRCQGD
jgi:hypothetical protein